MSSFNVSILCINSFIFICSSSFLASCKSNILCASSFMSSSFSACFAASISPCSKHFCAYICLLERLPSADIFTKELCISNILFSNIYMFSFILARFSSTSFNSSFNVLLSFILAFSFKSQYVCSIICASCFSSCNCLLLKIIGIFSNDIISFSSIYNFPSSFFTLPNF